MSDEDFRRCVQVPRSASDIGVCKDAKLDEEAGFLVEFGGRYVFRAWEGLTRQWKIVAGTPSFDVYSCRTAPPWSPKVWLDQEGVLQRRTGWLKKWLSSCTGVCVCVCACHKHTAYLRDQRIACSGGKPMDTPLALCVLLLASSWALRVLECCSPLTSSPSSCLSSRKQGMQTRVSFSSSVLSNGDSCQCLAKSLTDSWPRSDTVKHVPRKTS